MTLTGPRPGSPYRSLSPGPRPKPTVVTKSTCSTNALFMWRMTTMTSPHDAAISGAPPAPGSLTFGWS